MTKLFLAFLLIAASFAVATPSATHGQPAPFGSADNPREAIQRVWWQHESMLEVRGGLSLIGPQWRAATSMRLGLVTPPLTAELEGTVRNGLYGLYEPDLDEWYDVVRLLRFARYNAPPSSPLYLRAGLIQRMRMGTGHLVDFYASDTAWDDRTVGAEGYLRTNWGVLSAFTDNVVPDRVTASRVSFQPFSWINLPPFSSLELGIEAATDLSLRRDPDRADPTAFAADAHIDILEVGGIALTPFVSYASFLDFGHGFTAGASIRSPNMLDLARFHLAVSVHRNTDQFVPGYFDTFYAVNNPRARTVNSDLYFSSDTEAEQIPFNSEMLAGVRLEDIAASRGLETELRLLIYERLELWSRFLRHFGPQPLSKYNLRLFFQATDRGRFSFGFDRGGLTSLFSLFGELDDMTALTFMLDYQVVPGVWANVRSRYTFEHLSQESDGTRLYLAQRRFEPMAGLRVRF